MSYIEREYDKYLESLEETFECSECGKEMKKDKGVCSGQCFESSML